MPNWIRQLYTRIKAVGRRIQAAAVLVFLFLLYFLGLGPARIWAALFQRRILRPQPSSPDTAWLPASGYSLAVEERTRQS